MRRLPPKRPYDRLRRIRHPTEKSATRRPATGSRPKTLGYEPGVPDAPGWKLAVSRQTRGETPVVVYKAVGPAMVILLK